jgi:IS4 transposase
MYNTCVRPLLVQFVIAVYALWRAVQVATQVESLKQSYARPLPSLSLLYFLCQASPFLVSRTCIFSWCWMTLACCLLNLVTKSYTYGIWKDISWIRVFLGNSPMVWRALYCRCWGFIRCVSATNSQAGQAYVIMDLIRTSWRVNLLLVLNWSLFNGNIIS